VTPKRGLLLGDVTGRRILISPGHERVVSRVGPCDGFESHERIMGIALSGPPGEQHGYRVVPVSRVVPVTDLPLARDGDPGQAVVPVIGKVLDSLVGIFKPDQVVPAVIGANDPGLVRPDNRDQAAQFVILV